MATATLDWGALPERVQSVSSSAELGPNSETKTLSEMSTRVAPGEGSEPGSPGCATPTLPTVLVLAQPLKPGHVSSSAGRSSQPGGVKDLLSQFDKARQCRFVTLPTR